MSAPGSPRLGLPRVHLRETTSTNDRARALAARGAPPGTLVTAASQSAGRGRQGRTWTAPPGQALLCSLVLRQSDELLPLRAGVAVASLAGPEAALKWPNDVLVEGRKVAGILVEARPQEGWAVLGIGVNVAVRAEDLPLELRARAASLGLTSADVEPVLSRLLELLERWLAAPTESVLEAVRARDALNGQPVSWSGGSGHGAGIDERGRLRVQTGGEVIALDAGEVHLGAAPS
ncbi:MAG TPA: biotin--[acetyl-CoA-carboxylase] ligase [Solirubrobacteraceae bacterium]|nr:biotin--[acetyl-CoA-carboxylase] ligase [Solirubrobacteraceae bacterium]